MKNSAKMLMHLPLSFSELYNDLTKNHKRGLDLIEAAKLYSDERKFIEIFHEIMSD
jgi:predicted CopG family antitoxin